MKIADTHPHIISKDSGRYPITPLGGKRSGWSETRPADFGELVAQMDAAGIDKAVIVHSSTTYGYNAAYVADAIADHRDRFAGVFSVDVLQPNASEQIRYWVARGLSGLRLFAAGSTVKANQAWIADPATYPAWDYCAEHNVPVALSIRLEAVPHLIGITERFPKVQVVLDHLMLTPIEDGPPYSASAGLFDLADFPHAFLKLTTNNVRRSRNGLATPESFFGTLVDRFGSDRIMWGSNFPNEEGTLAQQVEEARADLAFLPPADRENIFWNTAVRVYPALEGVEAAAGAGA